MIEMIRRQQAAQATVARFKGQPHQFGKNDCVRMAAFVMRRMGHRPQLGKAGAYSSLKGAMAALKKAGFSDLAAALDSLGLQRIPAAAALPADIVMIPAVAFDGQLTIAVGNGRVLGWHEDIETAEILQPVEFVAAWRV